MLDDGSLGIQRHRRHVKDERRLAETAKRRSVLGLEGDESDSPEASLALYHRLAPSLQTVPQLFLSSKFNLKEPEQFTAVFLGGVYPQHHNPFQDEEPSSNPFGEEEEDSNPFSEDLKQEESLVPLRKNPELQERLSGWLDSVETRIGLQIAARSGAFFKAMASHDQLQTHLGQTKYAVQRLRSRMSALDERLVRKSLRLFALHRAQSNRETLQAKLEQLKTVAETQASVQMLLNQYDFLGALDIIRTTQGVLRDELRGIVAFRHLVLRILSPSHRLTGPLSRTFLLLTSGTLALTSVSPLFSPLLPRSFDLGGGWPSP